MSVRTVLIVDDDDGFRSIAEQMLRADGFQIVGAAVDGRSALKAARALAPDMVLLDIQLPDLDGFAVATELSREGNAPHVVLTSTRSASDYGARIDRAPALGFIRKDQLSGRALRALIAPA